MGTLILIFNSNNYPANKHFKSGKRIYETDRLLRAQILIALRGMDIHFPERLFATFTQMKFEVCLYKGQRFYGISGRFATNAVLPKHFAIGHAGSHGYGWIKPIPKEIK